MDKNTILRTIADNQALFNTVKEAILKHFPFNVSTLQSNEEMGQVVRAVLNGREAVEAAFREIEQYKTVKERPKLPMRAR